MNKHTIYGLPITPIRLLEQLEGASFCISYAHRSRMGGQIDRAIELVGKDGILLLDNGAYTHWRKGGKMTDEYIEAFFEWANPILARCPQAWFVYPDVIEGNVEENWQMVCESMMLAEDSDRGIPVWHLHEPLDYLIHMAEGFPYIAFGSTVDKPGSKNWHRRIKEAFAAIDQWLLDGEGAFVRPRIHMMRAQAFAHLYDFDSSDSSNVAVNHHRYKHDREDYVAWLAQRAASKIVASAGPEAEHQRKRPLLEHLDWAAWWHEHKIMVATMMAVERGLLPASVIEERYPNGRIDYAAA